MDPSLAYILEGLLGTSFSILTDAGHDIHRWADDGESLAWAIIFFLFIN